MPCTRVYKILSGGEFVKDFNSRFEVAVDERTRSAMLSGAHAKYELKKNIMCAGVRVKSGRRASEVRVGVSIGRLGVKACLPGGAQGERRELVASRGLNNKERCWPTLRKLVRSWSHFPNEPEAGRNQSTWSLKIEVWKAGSLDRVSREAAARAMPL